MATQHTTVLCGVCKAPVEGPADPKPQDVFSCPSCGNSDTFENVMASVNGYLKDFTARHIRDSWLDAGKGNKFVKLTAKPIPERHFPFIAEIKL